MTAVIGSAGMKAYKGPVMGKSTSRRTAGALLAALAAALLSPLGAFAAPSPAPARHGCHCPVKMACCEAGLCHAEPDDDAPATGPSWSGCRDEAPAGTNGPAPSTAYDSALLPAAASAVGQSASAAFLVTPDATGAAAAAPPSPPPRLPVDAR